MTIQEYNDLYKNPLIKKMRIISSGGIEITNTNICSEEMSLEESLCSDDNLTIGACEAACFKIRIADLNHDFTGEWLDVEQKLDTDIDGFLLLQGGGYLLLEGGGRIQLESIDGTAKYGRFKVFSDKPTNDRRWRNLTCYDAMYDILNAEVIEWYNGLTFPMTMKNFRDSFFTFLGYTQKTQTLVNDSFQIQGGFSNEGSLSGKTIITSICELNGVFGHISREGQFEYISLPSADTIALDWYMDGTGAYEDYLVQKITGIVARSSEDDVGTTVGTDTNLYVVEGNPLIYGSEGTASLTTALTNLLNNVKDINYRPFNVNTYGNPMLPLGTNLTVNTRNQTINSFVMTRVLSGIQSLVDSISAKGEQYRPTEVNSLRSETKRTKGKIHELINSVDELRSTIYDEDTGIISEIEQLSDEIVLKVDASGNIVKVKLSADASTGSTFAINADTITFVANKTIDLVTGNVAIEANNFSIDNAGNVIINGSVTCNDGKITITNSADSAIGIIKAGNASIATYIYRYVTSTGTIESYGTANIRQSIIIDSTDYLQVNNATNINGHLTVGGNINANGYDLSAKSAIIQDQIITTELWSIDSIKSDSYKLHGRYNDTDYENTFLSANQYQTNIGWSIYDYNGNVIMRNDPMLSSALSFTAPVEFTRSSDTLSIATSAGTITKTELGALSGIQGNIESRLAALEARL